MIKCKKKTDFHSLILRSLFEGWGEGSRILLKSWKISLAHSPRKMHIFTRAKMLQTFVGQFMNALRSVYGPLREMCF